jgi:hypothetical protein
VESRRKRNVSLFPAGLDRRTAKSHPQARFRLFGLLARIFQKLVRHGVSLTLRARPQVDERKIPMRALSEKSVCSVVPAG